MVKITTLTFILLGLVGCTCFPEQTEPTEVIKTVEVKVPELFLGDVPFEEACSDVPRVNWAMVASEGKAVWCVRLRDAACL